MRFLRAFSKFLFLVPLVMFTYDAVYSFFIQNNFKIRSLQAWGDWLSPVVTAKAKVVFTNLLSSPMAEKIFASPGPLVLLAPPVVLYLLYRVWFLIRGGHGASGGFSYRSPD